MDSYIEAPLLHANAVKNPKMAGGPFIDYGGKRVDEIKQLRERTVASQRDVLQLSTAIAELDEMLRANAKGYSLQPLYQSIPDILRGYVELTYDLNNNPSFRLIEPLLYRSHFYEKSFQSIMLSPISGDDRPFVLSTPRLEDDRSIHLKVPFDDDIVDEIFKMKRAPRPWTEISRRFEEFGVSGELLRSFFTEHSPRSYQPYTGEGARWRYFGHACILLETKGVTILIDPVLSYTYESDISRYTYEDLPEKIDYVLITHNHQDHVLFETLLQIRHAVRNIVVPRNRGGFLQDPSMRLMLEAVGFRNVIEIAEMQDIPIESGRITGLPFFGEHSDLSMGTKTMYLVETGRHKLMFAADSCNFEPRVYELVQKDIGDVDVLFLGMECDGAPLNWLYGPLLTQRMPRAMDESRRLAGSNYEQGLDFVTRFNCKEVYIYAMGQEPWLNYVMSIKYTAESRPIIESNKLIEHCRQQGICAERLFGEKEILLSP